MQSIIQTCQPRQELLDATFNPEIFKADLSKVLSDYKQGIQHSPIYSDPNVFFPEATFPTDGMKSVLATVFGRLSGDNTCPVVRRLETAFGGGKTHTLIAAIHLAMKGKTLAPITANIIDSALLPDEGEVTVIGIVGDFLKVQTQAGSKLKPHTLWGEIALQTGGQSLYDELRPVLESESAPGGDDPYFNKVFSAAKNLIIIDEIAVYATRSKGAWPGMDQQIASFMMSLLNYAQSRESVALIITLASDTNTFGEFNKSIRDGLSEVTGKVIDEDTAQRMAQTAHKAVLDVLNRDAEGISPVTTSELSKVMAKRLFVSIDEEAALTTAKTYMAEYRKSGADLPAGAQEDDYQDSIVANYPFHPTFINFLSEKLSQVEEFQGTRGVLRVLARVVRNAWRKSLNVPMLHSCHMDMADDILINDILGKTKNLDMKLVLQADIRAPQGSGATMGLTTAQSLDKQNKHPKGFPVYEWAWQTVFLHSLVGQEALLDDDRFGISEADAMLECAMPGMTPSQVRTALETIPSEADYLRGKDGRYYADTRPTITHRLKKIRQGIDTSERMAKIRDVARSLVTGGPFEVHRQVTGPEDIPDNKGKPMLAIIDPEMENIVPEKLCYPKPPVVPLASSKIMVFLLAPCYTKPVGATWDAAQNPDDERPSRVSFWIKPHMFLAIEKLRENPTHHGFSHNALESDEFREQGKQTRPTIFVP